MQNFNKNTFYTEQLWATASEVYLIMIWFCSRKTLQPKTLKHNKILTQLLKHCQIENFKETLKKNIFEATFFQFLQLILSHRRLNGYYDNCPQGKLPHAQTIAYTEICPSDHYPRWKFTHAISKRLPESTHISQKRMEFFR